MGKHSGTGKGPGYIGGRGDKPRAGGSARRVPAERRRTPGERSTAENMHAEETFRLSDPSSRRRGSLESAPARLRVERDRRRARSRRIAAIVAISALVFVVAAAAGVFGYAKYIERTMQSTVLKQGKLGAVLTKAKPMEPVNILVLGADYRKGDVKYRTDSMIIAHVDPQAKKVWLVSIPRDTRVELPDVGAVKINSAHVYGGPEGAVTAVESLTGLKMNHYVEVNFVGFRKAVDALGGIWIDVPVAINDKKADQSPGHIASKIDAGYQRLDGRHALTFVRARHQFADQDFSRMKNQQLFFRALADQLAKSSNIARLPQFVAAVAPYIQTDMSLVDMMRMAQSLRGSGSKNLYTTTLKGPWKSPFIHIDEEQLAEVKADIAAGRSFEATPTPSTAGASGTVTPAAAKKPSQISVTVRNGSGMAGVAKQAASILKAKTFQVGEVGNANQNVYDTTLVVYSTDKAAAELVASALPPGTKIVQSRGMYTFADDILVVVGKDWDVAKVPSAPVTGQ